MYVCFDKMIHNCVGQAFWANVTCIYMHVSHAETLKEFWENVTFYDYELLSEYIIDAFRCHHFLIWCACVVI